MAFYTLSDLAQREPLPGFQVRFVHTDNMSLAYWDIQQGAELPQHSHPHEQVLATVLQGEFELTVAGEVRIMRSGDIAVIPSDVPHSGRALSFCRLLDVFHPVREDYR